jgi:glyoxylase-like metal-dependent hydrolase (beta-lactamase superfamily II)
MKPLVWILVSLSLTGCVASAPAAKPLPPSLTRNRELESLAVAVRWPNAAQNVVVLLAGQYLAAHRDEEGYRYFQERADSVPERPLFTALAGLFHIRLASRVPLLKRVRWVEEGIAKLDRAAEHDPLSRFLRGLTFAQLPPRFNKREQAIADLGWMLEHAASFPPGLRRGAERALAQARGEPVSGDALTTDFTVGAAAGFRFVPPSLIEPVPGLYVARGYDFADLAFVTTDAGLVAIDAGTTEANVRTALAALRQKTTLPIRYVMITHAHWDHVGGLRALVQADTQVIAQARFAEELVRVNAAGVPFHFFFGKDAHGPYAMSPQRTIAQTESLTIGHTRFVLHPVSGGETNDALLIELPDSGVVFVGDAFMPYFGAPFVAEGSVTGLFDTIALLERLAPKLLIHGHTPLTMNFTVATIAPLSQALGIVHDEALTDLRQGKTLPDLLARNRMPDELARHPDAVLPFLLMRDNLIQRVYSQETGYWKADGEGMEVLSKRERAAALDLLASASEQARAAETLNQRGDFALALDLVNVALASHPESEPLRNARQTALDGLRAKYQFNPFKFLIYSEMAGRELAPLP